jgi:hypothetical protein
VLHSFLTESSFLGMCTEDSSGLTCNVTLKPEGANAFGILTDEDFNIEASKWTLSFSAIDSTASQSIVTDKIDG